MAGESCAGKVGRLYWPSGEHEKNKCSIKVNKKCSANPYASQSSRVKRGSGVTKKSGVVKERVVG